MTIVFSLLKQFFIKYLPTIILCISWCLGIFIGLHIASTSQTQFYMVYIAAVRKPAGFVGLAAVFFLPFLGSLIVLRYRKNWLLYPFCFCKALIFSVHFFLVSYIFGAGAWLVCLLFLFSEICSSVLLLVFWMITIKSDAVVRRQNCIIYLVLSTVALLLDLNIISAFLVSIC